MLMQEYSGLSTTQVNKMHFNLRASAAPLRSVFPVRPIVLLSTSLGLLSDALFDRAWIGLMVAALLIIGAYALHAGFCRWLAAFNHDRTVLVVRDGLIRGTTLAGLVAGDLVKVPAGTLLAADVETDAAAVPSTWLKVILKLTGKQMPAGIALAGSRLQADTQARVIAVGNDRFIAHMAADLFAVKSELPLRALIVLLTTGLISLIGRVKHALGSAKLAGQVSMKVKHLRPAALRLPRTLKIGAGVLSDVAADKETAFRYNQDPVTSPRPSI